MPSPISNNGNNYSRNQNQLTSSQALTPSSYMSSSHVRTLTNGSNTFSQDTVVLLQDNFPAPENLEILSTPGTATSLLNALNSSYFNNLESLPTHTTTTLLKSFNPPAFDQPINENTSLISYEQITSLSIQRRTPPSFFVALLLSSLFTAAGLMIKTAADKEPPQENLQAASTMFIACGIIGMFSSGLAIAASRHIGRIV